MTEADIFARLEHAEEALAQGKGLDGTGFWKAVGAVKRSPELAESLGPRIGDIDRRAFERWALVRVPEPVGTTLALAVTAGGMGALAVAGRADEPWSWLIFGAGTGILLVTTHGLGHLVAGRAMGMRFTHWFVARLDRPQPGVKVDYATYLGVPARQRAWMHAAGALVTKAMPFALIPAAVASGLPRWVGWALAATGAAAIVTDVAWSMKASDWKKFRREMRHAAS